MKLRCVLIICLLLVGKLAHAQQLTPAQKAELDQLAREAKAEFEKAFDPANMKRQFKEQLDEARRNGATPAQLRELEKAQADALKQLEQARQAGQNPATAGQAVPDPDPTNLPDPSDKTDKAKSADGLMARLNRPDSLPVPSRYDVLPGRYSPVPAAFRVYPDRRLDSAEFGNYMQKEFGVTLRQTGQFEFGGIRTRRYEQLHAGYVVRLAAYSITLDTVTGHVARANGTLFRLVGNPAAPPRPATALLAALRQATKLPGLPLLPAIPDSLPPTYALAQGPVWVPPGLDPAKPPVLTVPFSVETPTSSRLWYLDAQTGAVVASENRRRTCAHGPKPTTAKQRVVHTFYQDKQPVMLSKGTLGKKSVYYVADSTETPFVVVQRPSYNKSPEFFTPQWQPDSSLLDSKLRVDGVFDMLLSFRQTARYFKRLGLNSFDGAGATIHTQFRANEENAWWDPSPKGFFFGEMASGRSLASLDVVAHEFMHAVTEKLAGLVYQGESGAVNESLSDMFGKSVEHQTTGGSWVIADRVTPGGFRNMANPKSKQEPDTYLEEHWASTAQNADDDGGVHTNSGVGNKWFWLLIKGGKGQNDLKQPYDVFPTVPYRQLTSLLLGTLPRLSPTSGYEDLCRETIATAEARYGSCNPATEAIKRAWYAVGVLDDPPIPCLPGYTMDMVMRAEGQRKVMKYYFKGDSVVSVHRHDEGILKIFTHRRTPYLTVVAQTTDGLETHRIPKDVQGMLQRNLDEMGPLMEAEGAKALAKARAEMANPNTSPERRAELAISIPQTEAFLKQARKGRAEAKAEYEAAKNEPTYTDDLSFWGSRQYRRQFDKDHIVSTQKWENKYLTRRYALKGDIAGIKWASTRQIPYYFSDLILLTPINGGGLDRPGIDYFLRGFPINFMDTFQMQNIIENVPRHYDRLFSADPVWQ